MLPLFKSCYMITVDNKFDIGQTVFLKTDPDQKERVVFALEVTQGDTLYKLASGTEISTHYHFEILAEKNVLAGLTN